MNDPVVATEPTRPITSFPRLFGALLYRNKDGELAEANYHGYKRQIIDHGSDMHWVGQPFLYKSIQNYNDLMFAKCKARKPYPKIVAVAVFDRPKYGTRVFLSPLREAHSPSEDELVVPRLDITVHIDQKIEAANANGRHGTNGGGEVQSEEDNSSTQ